MADRVELTLVGGVAERRRISISAAEHRGRFFYVVMVHPMDV